MKLMKKTSRKLLVVESPTKAKTIGKYLGNDYEVLATVGHLRDLPKSKMGVDMAHDFAVDYVVDAEKKRVVADLKRAAASASEVLLATDPDREGEAISWHVKEILEESLKLKGTSKKEISRISFHEITKAAVEEALTQAREIDMDLVNAQQGRRVLDRVVGYSLSPVLWKKVRRGLSAGRVQSVAVRLICEREKEREAFTSENFYKVSADFGTFLADLEKVASKNVVVSVKSDLFDGSYTYSKTIFSKLSEVELFLKNLGPLFTVSAIDGKETNRNPLPPYTTSKLQQAAARRFGWSGKQTMNIAQRLYEKGLITYHRTDSVNLSDKAVAEFRSFIGKKYGSAYVEASPRHFKNTSKNAQEAHEAIRPTDVTLEILETEDNKQRRLYDLIWKRAVATQATKARLKSTKVMLQNGTAEFGASGITTIFDGFLKITGAEIDEVILPEMKVGQELKSKKTEYIEQKTMPPPRYNDASLVSSLEKQGIGRPSTYAPIISTILNRQYVERDEGRFKPTALGIAANLYLVKNFEDIMSLPFTAEMEENLDKIAAGKLDWKKMMKTFWTGFEKEIKTAEKDSERVKVVAESIGEKCPECQEGDLVLRTGKFGKFISCDRFPDCKYTRQYKELAGFVCPLCGSEAVVKKTKAGRKYFGCANYPNCKWAGWKKP